MGEISNKVSDKNNNFEIKETFTNSAVDGIISQLDYFDHDVSNVKNLNNYYIVQPNDFVYNPRISSTAMVGPVNRNKLNRIGVMSPLYTVFRIYKWDLTFIEYYFKTNYWHSYMKWKGNTGARSDRFSINDVDFFQMPILIPTNFNEQQKIGSFFNELDNLITLHQRE